MEIRFHSKVDLNIATFKPASTALRQFRWFGKFCHAQQFSVKGAGSVFFARRHGELHVVDGSKGMIHQCTYLMPTCPRTDSINFAES